MFIQVIQGRATNPPGIRRDLGRWQRQLAADADGWLGSTTGITEDGWSITVVRFASQAQARRNSDRPEHREWWRDASQHLARVAVHDAPKVHTYRKTANGSSRLAIQRPGRMASELRVRIVRRTRLPVGALA